MIENKYNNLEYKEMRKRKALLFILFGLLALVGVTLMILIVNIGPFFSIVNLPYHLCILFYLYVILIGVLNYRRFSR